MALKLKTVQEISVPLNLPVDEDPDQEAFVVVRQASRAEDDRRSQLGSTSSRIYREGSKEVEVKGSYVYADQQRLEVFLTLCDCSIEIPDLTKTDTYKKLFRFQRGTDNKLRVAMSEADFNTAWGLLPADWAEAVHRAVLQVNPKWDPNFSS